MPMPLEAITASGLNLTTLGSAISSECDGGALFILNGSVGEGSIAVVWLPRRAPMSLVHRLHTRSIHHYCPRQHSVLGSEGRGYRCCLSVGVTCSTTTPTGMLGLFGAMELASAILWPIAPARGCPDSSFGASGAGTNMGLCGIFLHRSAVAEVLEPTQIC